MLRTSQHKVTNLIPHVLCHGYQWHLVEISEELPTFLFNGYKSLQEEMTQTCTSNTSTFHVLQDAITKV